MKFKNLAFLLLGLFLVSFSSAAVASYGEWTDGSNSQVITDGDSSDFEVSIFTMNPYMSYSVKMYDSAWNQIHIFDAGTTFAHEYSNFFTVTESIYQIPGDYTVSIFGTDSLGSTYIYSIYLTVNPTTPIDDEAPVITLLGDNPVEINLTDFYTDAGATALDDVDGDITSQILTVNSVDTNIVGTYIITYNVNDSSNNSALEVTRTVNVVDPYNPPIDDVAPVITLLGNNPIEVNLTDSYLDAGATALDDVDGDITSSIITINPVDTNTLGTYVVTYNVNDSSNNSALEVTRTVNVVDPYNPPVDDEDPVITVIYPVDGRTYYSKYRIFKVSINEDSNVWYSLDGDNNVSMSKIGDFVFEEEDKVSYGDHELIFYARDLAGNWASAEVEFEVKKTSRNTEDSNRTITGINYYEAAYNNETIDEIYFENEQERLAWGWIIILALLIGILSISIIIVLIVKNRNVEVDELDSASDEILY